MQDRIKPSTAGLVIPKQLDIPGLFKVSCIRTIKHLLLKGSLNKTFSPFLVIKAEAIFMTKFSFIPFISIRLLIKFLSKLNKYIVYSEDTSYSVFNNKFVAIYKNISHITGEMYSFTLPVTLSKFLSANFVSIHTGTEGARTIELEVKNNTANLRINTTGNNNFKVTGFLKIEGIL